jgi:putative inorganic carbon (HCO3(-)) transporter
LNGSRAAWTARSLDGWSLAATGLIAGLALGIALLPLPWVVLLVLGSAAVLATLVRPQLGVLLVVLAVPFGSLRQVRIGVMNVGVTEVLVALVLAAWLMRMIARREVTVKWPPLTLPFGLFFIVLSLSSLSSVSLQHSLKELVKWVEVLALYVLAANVMTGRWKKALVAVLLGTGALAALHGIFQFLFQIGPEEFILFGRFMRAHGTFEQPNPYAGYLGLTLPLAIGLVFAVIVPMGRRVSSRWLVCASGTGALIAIAVVMSWSRGAWLGIAAAGGVMLVAVAARSGRAAVLGVVFAVLLAYLLLAGGASLLPPSIVQRFSDFVPYLGVADVRGVEITDANFAVVERMAHWQAAIEMWTDRPWLGVGIGNYEVVYARYSLPLWPVALGHAHNYYLNIGAEAGIIGLLAYLVLWGAALLQSWKATRHARDWNWGMALGVLGVIVHLSIHNLFDNLFVHAMYLQVAILLGLLASLKNAPQDSDDIPMSGERKPLGGSA